MLFLIVQRSGGIRRMAGGLRPTKLATWLGLTLLAGAAAGVAAVYVSGGFSGNNTVAATTNCDTALTVARTLDPLAKGEVAAFRATDKPEDLSGLAFTAADGSETTIGQAFPGRAVLLNIWATWCVPCRTEMPSLDRLEQALGGDRFTVAAVNIDIGASGAARAKTFLDEIGVKDLAFLTDPSTGVFKDLKGRGLALGLPTSVLLDGKGCRLGVVAGPAEWDSEDAKALIKAAIGPG
jgi:thiol-disulfide isomerase/thioredoxin